MVELPDYQRVVDKLGPPSISIGGLNLWLEDSTYEVGSTFLTIRAVCAAENAVVWTYGTIMLLEDIEQWIKNSEPLYEELTGTAGLSTLEGKLGLELTMNRIGNLLCKVDITPDPSTQQHVFSYQLDQTHLLAFIQGCKRVIASIRHSSIRG